MTKPVTSVAAMMLYEEGAFELNDPISKWLPEFAQTRVYVAGSAQKPVTAPQVEPIRVWHLLTHMSGLTYGFHHAHPVDAMYRAMGHEWGTLPGADSAEVVRQWASVPLVFQPGSEWNYGVSTDVLGRLVEVLSGQPLDEFFEQRIFAPLGCAPRPSACVRTTTPPPWPACTARAGAAGRAATGFAFLEAFDAAAHTKPAFLSGGGGLVSTAGDYLRFVEVLRRRGAYDGGACSARERSRTWSATTCPATRPGGLRPAAVRRDAAARVGFGLGFSMVIDPVRYSVVANAGDYSWGGRLDGVLRRPGRGHHRQLLHAAAAVEHAADPQLPPRDGEPGHLDRSRRRSPWTPPAPWSKEDGDVHRAAPPQGADWRLTGIRVVHADDLDVNTPQTPGMNRAAAINAARAGAEKLWAGTVLIHPAARTGAHHHGHLESVIYVVRGAPGCGGASDSSSRPRRDRATSSSWRRSRRTRRSTPVPTNPCSAWSRSGQEPVVVNLELADVEARPDEVRWVDDSIRRPETRRGPT